MALIDSGVIGSTGNAPVANPLSSVCEPNHLIWISCHVFQVEAADDCGDSALVRRSNVVRQISKALSMLPLVRDSRRKGASFLAANMGTIDELEEEEVDDEDGTAGATGLTGSPATRKVVIVPSTTLPPEGAMR